MKKQIMGKKSFIAFFQQINKLTAKHKSKRFAAGPRSDKNIMEQLNFENVAYLSDN